MFDWKKPTVQMLGRWQPWHAGHTALFEKALSKTGQVAILVRDVEGWQDNPFSWTEVITNIRNGLDKAGYRYGVEYIIMKVPNIVDISYGRGVGYTFTEHDLGAEIHDISATRIRKEMREKGDL
tara:strand:+ start:436 stop:807 length:372 start_codon:yes stop_codon:yes gene_type:complete